MALQRTKETIVTKMDYIDYDDLNTEVEKRLSEREGRKVDTRDYAGGDEARRLAFIETNKLGDNSWYSTSFVDHTEVQKQQYDIFKKYTDHIPYQDFWHWWMENVDPDLSNDETSDIYWDYNELASLVEDEEEEFILKILEVYNEVLLETFTQEELDKGIQIHYSW